VRNSLSLVTTDDGVELPVIDVTHPAFALSLSEAALAELEDAFWREERRRERLPKLLQRLFLKVFLRKSLLARGLRSGKFLSALDTYLFKLGPDCLPASAAPIDRVIAASLPAVSMRLRLQDMASLLAEALAPALEARTERSLRLVNIGGGTCIDSLNALLVARRDHPDLLDARPIELLALDLDASGASFGARCLASLQRGPLHGVDVTLQHRHYDWATPERLGEFSSSTDDAFVAVSSEGALFEYPEDAIVVGNLEALHAVTPRDAVVVGSVTSDSPVALRAAANSPIRLRPRSLEAFEALAARAAWKLDRVIERPCCRDVRLLKA
jgi:hypothetical protein